MKVFSILMSWSSESKSCMKVDESFLNSKVLVKEDKELHES